MVIDYVATYEKGLCVRNPGGSPSSPKCHSPLHFPLLLSSFIDRVLDLPVKRFLCGSLTSHDGRLYGWESIEVERIQNGSD